MPQLLHHNTIHFPLQFPHVHTVLLSGTSSSTVAPLHPPSASQRCPQHGALLLHVVTRFFRTEAIDDCLFALVLRALWVVCGDLCDVLFSHIKHGLVLVVRWLPQARCAVGVHMKLFY